MFELNPSTPKKGIPVQNGLWTVTDSLYLYIYILCYLNSVVIYIYIYMCMYIIRGVRNVWSVIIWPTTTNLAWLLPQAAQAFY